MKLVSVTGANGFVGRHLCNALHQSGYRVRACVRRGSPIPDELLADPDAIEIRAVDHAGERTDWSGICDGASAIFHLAARVHVMHDVSSNPLREFRVANVDQTRALAESAVASGVKRFVYLSSIKVNGETSPQDGFRATDQPAFSDPYGQSKWEAELSLRQFAATSGLEVVTIRPPLVYGPAVKGNFATLLRLVQRQLPLPLGLIRNQRSLVSVRNLCDLMIVAAKHPKAAGGCFLVRDRENLSTPRLIALIAAALGKRARLFPIPTSALELTARLTGRSAALTRLLSNLTVNDHDTRRRLDWRPPFSTSESLAQTAEWFLKSVRKD